MLYLAADFPAHSDWSSQQIGGAAPHSQYCSLLFLRHCHKAPPTAMPGRRRQGQACFREACLRLPPPPAVPQLGLMVALSPWQRPRRALCLQNSLPVWKGKKKQWYRSSKNELLNLSTLTLWAATASEMSRFPTGTQQTNSTALPTCCSPASLWS